MPAVGSYKDAMGSFVSADIYTRLPAVGPYIARMPAVGSYIY